MTSSTTTDITAQARRVLEEIFPADDEQALRAALAEGFVNHEAPEGMPPGPESAVMFMHLLHGAFSDQRWTIHRTVTEGDVVVIHCTHSGRHTGDFFGRAATGREFAYEQMHLIRFADGLGAEQWALRDDQELGRQLGDG